MAIVSAAANSAAANAPNAQLFMSIFRGCGSGISFAVHQVSARTVLVLSSAGDKISVEINKNQRDEGIEFINQVQEAKGRRYQPSLARAN